MVATPIIPSIKGITLHSFTTSRCPIMQANALEIPNESLSTLLAIQILQFLTLFSNFNEVLQFLCYPK